MSACSSKLKPWLSRFRCWQGWPRFPVHRLSTPSTWLRFECQKSVAEMRAKEARSSCDQELAATAPCYVISSFVIGRSTFGIRRVLRLLRARACTAGSTNADNRSNPCSQHHARIVQVAAVHRRWGSAGSSCMRARSSWLNSCQSVKISSASASFRRGLRRHSTYSQLLGFGQHLTSRLRSIPAGSKAFNSSSLRPEASRIRSMAGDCRGRRLSPP